MSATTGTPSEPSSATDTAFVNPSHVEVRRVDLENEASAGTERGLVIRELGSISRADPLSARPRY